MDVFVAALLSVAVIICYLIFSRKKRDERFPPGPSGWPIIGYLHKLGGNSLYIIFNELSEKYGDIFSLRLGSYPAIVISSRDILHEAFVKKAATFSGRPKMRTFKLHHGSTGLGRTDITKQYRLNKGMNTRALQHLFADKKALDETVNKQAGKMMNVFNTYINKNSAFDPGEEFNYIIPFLFNSIMFGIDIDYDDAYFRKYCKISERGFEISEHDSPTDFLDFKFFDWIPNQHMEEVKYVNDTLNHYALTLLKQYKEEANPSLLSSYIAQYHRDLNEADLTQEEVDEMAQVITDVSAGGFDTVASVLSWAILYLSKYQDIKEKCRKEIYSVVEKDQLSIDNEHSLPYFVATIYDLLRLTTVGPLGIPHATTKDVQLASFVIPKGTIVFASLWKINHDPKVWTNPTVLCPEHFLDVHGKIDKMALKNISTFSHGARRCPGEKLAFYEIFLMLGAILQCYDWKIVSPPSDMLPRRGLTSKPKKYQVLFQKASQ